MGEYIYCFFFRTHTWIHPTYKQSFTNIVHVGRQTVCIYIFFLAELLDYGLIEVVVCYSLPFPSCVCVAFTVWSVVPPCCLRLVSFSLVHRPIFAAFISPRVIRIPMRDILIFKTPPPSPLSCSFSIAVIVLSMKFLIYFWFIIRWFTFLFSNIHNFLKEKKSAV